MKQHHSYSFERYAARRLYYAFDFLPGTRDIIYSANMSGQFNVWRQKPPSPSGMGEARQLTGFVEWSVRHIAPHPSGRWVLAYADKDGDENYQAFKIDADRGWHEPLIFKTGVRHEWGRKESFSPNGRFVAYSSNERNPRDMDVLITDLSDGKSRPIVSGGGFFLMGCWSPDGNWVTAVEVLSTDDYNIILVNVKTGERKNLTPHSEKAVYIPGPWTRDSSGFYMLTNQDSEFVGVAHKPSHNGGELKWLETPKSDVQDIALSPNGRTLAWTENREGYSTLNLRDLRTGKILGRPVKTDGTLLPGWFDNIKLISFSPDGKQLIYLLTKPTMPAEIHVLQLPGMNPIKYTDGFIGNIPEGEMATSKLVQYDSFDRKIPAFLYKPTVKPGTKAPGVVVVHGGPEAQERPQYAYAGLYQYLLSRGIGVLALNIRGSTGYGKKYQRLIHHDWGGDELKDIDQAAKYFKSLDWVDPERLAIFGGSFGGFAVLSATTRLPEHWKAAVDIFGPSNLVTFAKAVPEHWKPFMADLLGDPDTEANFLHSRSPMTYIDQLKCPILIIQGANDPRVVKPESDQIVEKLRSMNRQVEYTVFSDEGHGFTKQKNEFAAYKLVTEFLAKHLLTNGEK